MHQLALCKNQCMIAIGFLALTLIVAIVLVAGINATAKRAFNNEGSQQKIVLRAALFLVLWLGYITLTSVNGIYNNTTLPPRVPLLLVLPAFASGSFILFSGRNRQLIAALPPSWPVYFQVFRVGVELLLLLLAMNNMIPREATFDGYNFDVIIGLSAPVVAWAVFQNRALNILLYLWNVAGFITLAIVVVIFMTHAYAPALWHKQESIVSRGFGLFPYTYLAGFLMPCAVFMHVLSLIKLRQERAGLQVDKQVA